MINRIAVLFFFSHNFPTTEVNTEAIKKAGKIADLFLITTLPREWNLF
jgi:hypothetical protein